MMHATELRAKLGLSKRQWARLLKAGLPFTADARDKRRKQFDATAVRRWLIDHDFAVEDAGEPIFQTKADCANYFRVSERQVGVWLNDPTFPGRAGHPGKRDGYFPAWQITTWRGAQTLVSGNGADDALTAKAREARARKIIVNSKLEEIKLAEKQRQVADVEAMRRLYVQTHALAKQCFRQVWPRIRELLPRMPPEKVTQLQQSVEAECRRAEDAFREGIRSLDLLVGLREGESGDEQRDRVGPDDQES